MSLTDEQITPPVAGSKPLTVFEAQKLGAEISDWSLHTDHLERIWHFPTFEAALDFVLEVGKLASETAHHPDIHLSYKTVRLELSTHKIGGLSRNDFLMAAKINALAMQPV